MAALRLILVAIHDGQRAPAGAGDIGAALGEGDAAAVEGAGLGGRLPITLCVNTRNAAQSLPGCIESCADWVTEILVVDMESEDETVAVARRLGARVVQISNSGIVEPGRQRAIDEAGQPWVLLLDADERALPGLRELAAADVERNEVAGVYLLRRNYIFGRWIRHSGWWPDIQMRLFQAGAVRWPPHVHSAPDLDGPTAARTTAPAIDHFNYATISEFVARSNRYTDFEAQRLDESGQAASASRLVWRPLREFLTRYVRLQGFRDGRHGLALAVLMAFYAATVELKLWERQRPQAATRGVLIDGHGR